MHHTIFLALASALGLDPESREASALIRAAYANPSPARPAPEADAVYWHLVPDSGRPPLRENPPGEGFRFVPLRLNLVFYGLHAEALAWRVWQRFFLDGPGQPRRILRQARLYPVPGPSGPAVLWEEAGREHRPRADLTIQLWAAISEALPLPGPVEVPPEIILAQRLR